MAIFVFTCFALETEPYFSSMHVWAGPLAPASPALGLWIRATMPGSRIIQQNQNWDSHQPDHSLAMSQNYNLFLGPASPIPL